MESLGENDMLFIERFLHAFKVLGGDENGLIDYDNFKSLLLQKGGEGAKEALHLIEEECFWNDNKLDFVGLCMSILSTKAIFNRLSLENGRLIGASPRINTRTYTRKKNSIQTPNVNNSSSKGLDSKKVFSQHVKGSLYSINEDLLSNHYKLEVLENTNVEIFAKPVTPLEDSQFIPIEIIVFQGKNKAFLTSSSIINSEGCNAVKINLKKGEYLLSPVLLKWNGDNRNSDNYLNPISLMEINEEEVNLTPSCENALKLIFDSIDLDGNGLLSQLEFDLFIQHTAGETAAEEWSTIEDNFKMENHELTLEGFLDLYKMVLQTDPDDVRNMFLQMGMTSSLERKYAQPFVLVCRTETSKCSLTPLHVTSYCNIVDKVLCKMAVEQGSSSKIKNMNDLFLYVHKLPHRATIIIQNQSHSKVTVRLDCTRSNNCTSHRKTLDFTVEVQPRTSVIGQHLFPIDPKLAWSFECIESLK